jgi:hypothetical protein
MKKLVFIFLAVAFSAIASAQIVNLSGNWTLNVNKSSLNEQFSLAPQSCNMNQTDSVLTVEKKLDMMGQQMTITEKFNLDGSECTNPGIMESVKKSKAIFSDDQKSILISSEITTADMGTIKLTEKYTIDNENLIYQSTSSSTSFGDMSETAAYNKN